MGNGRTEGREASLLNIKRYVPLFVMLTVTLGLSIFFGTRPEPQAPIADVTEIPAVAGDWRLLQSPEIDANTMKQIQADSYVSRIYGNSAGQIIELLVVYRRYGRREFAHRPELCFPAAGYSITKNNNTTLTWAGKEHPARFLTATAAGRPEETITYFFASGKRTEEDFIRQQIWMAFERVSPNKNGWTFIRLVSPTRTTTADALAAQQDFMKSFAPEIEKVITTDKKGEVTASL